MTRLPGSTPFNTVLMGPRPVERFRPFSLAVVERASRILAEFADGSDMAIPVRTLFEIPAIRELVLKMINILAVNETDL